MQNLRRMGWDVVGNVIKSNASIVGGVDMEIMKGKMRDMESREIHQEAV